MVSFNWNAFKNFCLECIHFQIIFNWRLLLVPLSDWFLNFITLFTAFSQLSLVQIASEVSYLVRIMLLLFVFPLKSWFCFQRFVSFAEWLPIYVQVVAFFTVAGRYLHFSVFNHELLPKNSFYATKKMNSYDLLFAFIFCFGIHDDFFLAWDYTCEQFDWVVLVVHVKSPDDLQFSTKD